MKFRPCIDLHEGRVKQIIGGSLSDSRGAVENFTSEHDAEYFASMYKNSGLSGGHIAMLDRAGSPGSEANIREAVKALNIYPGGLQVGGGINNENASLYLDAGASHVIVTSYVFKNGAIDYSSLEKLFYIIGREKLVLDLSCRKKNGKYFVVTDRWQKFTGHVLGLELLEELSGYCSEFLIHGVDVEGKKAGIDPDLVTILGRFEKGIITYAGGVSTTEDIRLLEKLGRGRVDFTVGSGLDIFGGDLSYKELTGLYGQ